MTGDKFTATGWRRVLDQVGQGNLKGVVRVDQVYAKYHHERMDLHHPRGGGPKYLESALHANYQDYLERVARAFLKGDPEQAMARAMESLNTAMAARAPVQFNNLRRSGNPRVISQGAVVYNRAAKQHRLSRAELNAERRGRGRRRSR